MSHLRERKEKNCLNCRTIVQGRFCHVCGQQNIEPKESVLHLANHFINDVTHFDGKFFSSLKLLLTKPGFLSKEYMAGRRASYLNPIRMYLFTSAIFFLVFFSVLKTDIIKLKTTGNNDYIATLDSATFNKLVKKTNNGTPISREALKKKLDSANGIFSSRLPVKSKRDYDSLLRTGVRKDNWFMRQLTYKFIQINTHYGNNSNGFSRALADKFNHSFPQMLFVLLPLFALILKALHIKKKEYYYTDHLIFVLHLYIFLFIALLFILGLNKMADLLHSNWPAYISFALTVTVFFYFYKSMRNFYQQRRAKTILTYFIALFGLLLALIILLFFFFFLSLFQV